jgi:hypothetical protein
MLKWGRGEVGANASGRELDVLRANACDRLGVFQKSQITASAWLVATIRDMTDELDRISPKESAHVKARDRKARGPKVIAVNPGLKKLALHIAEKTRKPKRTE